MNDYHWKDAALYKGEIPPDAVLLKLEGDIFDGYIRVEMYYDPETEPEQCYDIAQCFNNNPMNLYALESYEMGLVGIPKAHLREQEEVA